MVGETEVPPQEAQFARPIDEVECINIIVDPDSIRTTCSWTLSIPLKARFNEGIVVLGFGTGFGVDMEDARDMTTGGVVNVIDAFGSYIILESCADNARFHGTNPDYKSQFNGKFGELGESFWCHGEVECGMRCLIGN